MKTYSPPKLLMHTAVEFGTTNISNNFFYQWCKAHHFEPFICKVIYGPGGPGGPCGCKPLSYLDGKDLIK